jgi:hypothetical protein
MIGPGGLLLVVSHLFAGSVLVLLVGLHKSKWLVTKLGSWMRDIFLEALILSTIGDALSEFLSNIWIGGPKGI